MRTVCELKCLTMASMLSSDWSLVGEVIEDMDITRDYFYELKRELSKRFGILLDHEDGKVRLSFTTSTDQVKMAMKYL